jgi:hypothetical protein
MTHLAGDARLRVVVEIGGQVGPRLARGDAGEMDGATSILEPLASLVKGTEPRRRVEATPT